ncbi:MAG: hypothetical protein ABSG90_10435 [Dehalococcoidia bacterium]|jgi:phage gp45-like
MMQNRSSLLKAIVFSLLILIPAAIAACSSPAAAPAPVAQDTSSTAPLLTVDPPTIDEQFTEGDTMTRDETVNVHNEGGGIMIWAATATYPWIWMEDTSGSLERLTMSTVKVHISASTLKAGTYTGNINVEGAGADQSPQTVKVTIVVKPAPVSTTANGGPVKKATPLPPWEYTEYKNDTYHFVLKYPQVYQVKQLPVNGADFVAVSSTGNTTYDMIMVAIASSYGIDPTDVVLEFAKSAVRVAGGRPNPKLVSTDNTTTLADGVTPASEYIYDSESAASPSYEFYTFGFKKGSRYIFFGAVSTEAYAATRLETWKQIGQTFELVD